MFSMRKSITAGALALLLLLSVLPVPTAATEPAFGTLWAHFSRLEAQWLSQCHVYEEVPLYFQTDYPDTPYGHGTVSTSGCGITCLAMAASYLKSRQYTPDGLAEQFGSLQMTNVERINHAIKVLDLPLDYMPTKWSQMMAALRNGQIVILLINEKSRLTDGQHMVVLTGLSNTGRVLVHDPYEPSYSNGKLANGYARGFQESDLSKGFDGGWIFEKKDPADCPDYATPYRNFRSMDWVSE